MSREIKFRVWDNIAAKIEIVEQLIFDENNKLIFVSFVNEYTQKVEPFDLTECQLMQFTGLKDKNGNEIYEGDIISVNGKYPKIIEYSAEHFGFVLINISDSKHADWKEIKQRPSQCWFSDFKREIKIIGNIHENKELLKN